MPKPAPKSSKVAGKAVKSAASKAGGKAKTPTRPAKSDAKKADAKHPEVKADKKVDKVAEPKKADAKTTSAKTAKSTEAKKGAKAPLIEVKKTPAKGDKGKPSEKHETKASEGKAHESKKGDSKVQESKSDAKSDGKQDAKQDLDGKTAKVAAAKAEEDAKSGRKGITIVTPKPAKKAPPKPTPIGPVPMSLGRLMDPTNPPRRPLIPSGPRAAATRPLGAQGTDAAAAQPVKGKSPFGKRELDRYRDLLIVKRAELVGDVKTMESQALQGDSGSLSSTPQHMAEQGSETYDQSLSLDLAAADRKLIREIDDALTRIEQGTFGICEITGKPIKLERLEELPWARYTIEAQRELERLRMRI